MEGENSSNLLMRYRMISLIKEASYAIIELYIFDSGVEMNKRVGFGENNAAVGAAFFLSFSY